MIACPLLTMLISARKSPRPRVSPWPKMVIGYPLSGGVAEGATIVKRSFRYCGLLGLATPPGPVNSQAVVISPW